MNHDRYREDEIRSILQSVRTIALVGATTDKVRPAHLVMQYLLDKGYDVYPVNPRFAGEQVLGRTVNRALAEVPVPIDMVDIFRNSQAAGRIVDDALALVPLPRVIWMQLLVRNDEAASRAEAKGVKVVMNRCPKMEYGKLSGEWAWIGGASGLISSRRQQLHASGRVQSLGIGVQKR